MVTFTGTPGIEVNGVVVGYRAEYTARTSTESKYQAIERRTSDVSGGNNLNRGQYYVQLGEELYNGDLKLNDDSLDVFGRPSRTWTYMGTEVGTYAKKELLVAEPYTVGVTGRQVYDLLGQATIRDNDLDAYVDGEDNTDDIVKTRLVRTNDSDLPNTGRGVLTEIYLDNDKELITIVSINTYLAQVNSDYSESAENVSITVYDAATSSITKLVDVEDVPGIVDLKKDDWILINWADETANKVVVDVFEPEIMENVEVTGFNSSTEQFDNYNDNDVATRRVTEITTGGTTYKNNRNAWYKQNTLNNYSTDRLVDKTYTIYMDQYGNFIGAELYSGANQYVFITGYDRPKSAIAVSTANANAIFTDGSMGTISVNVTDTNKNIDRYNTDKYNTVSPTNTDYDVWSQHTNHEEMWYTYTLRGDVYTLTPAALWTRHVATQETTVQSNRIRLVPSAITPIANAATGGTGNSYGDNDSVYITVSMGNVDENGGNFQNIRDTKGITEIGGVYTGVQDVKLVYQTGDWAHAVYEEDGSRIVACIVLGEAEGVVDNYAFIRTGAYSERVERNSDARDGGDLTHYWKVDVIINGELKTMEIKSKWESTAGTLVPGTVQELILDTDGYITKINSLPNSLGTTHTGIEYSDNDTTNITDAAAQNKDKVYTNYDYKTNATAGKPDSADLIDYNVYDINIGSDRWSYDGNTVDNTYGAGALSSTACPWNSSYTYANLSVGSGTIVYNGVGNDIFLGGAAAQDLGLPYVAGVPAIVYQQIGEKWVYKTYASVESAFGVLYDANPDLANGNNMKQFSGRVIAALDTQGRAEWVFFHDYTPAPSSTTGTPGFQGKGIHVELGETVAQVNALLSAGNNVTVDGNWLPADTALGTQYLRVPAGRTLYINGDFNTVAPLGVGNVMTITSASGGNIVVNGKVIVNSTTAGAIAYNLTTVSGDLELRDATSSSYTLSGTIKVAGDIRGLNASTGASQTTTLNITGHVEANNVNVNAAGSVIVQSVNTLIANNVVGKLYLNNTTSVASGAADKNGYVKISGSVTEFYNYNKNQAAGKTPEIGTATANFVNGAGNATIVTGNWNPTNATLAAGSTITFQGDGKATGTAAGMFKNASGVTVDTTKGSFTVGATDATKVNATISNPVVVTNDTTAPYSIGEVTFTFANDDPTKPVMNVEVIVADGVTTTGTNDVYVVATTGETTANKGTTTFTESKAIVTFDLTGSGAGKFNLTLTTGTEYKFNIQLAKDSAGTDKVGAASTASYTHAQTYAVTVASGDKVEFYESNLAGNTALATGAHNYAAGKVLYVKLASTAADDYIMNTDKVAAVSGQAGWYTLELSENVNGTDADNDSTGKTLVIAKVTVKGTVASNVEIYEDAAATATKVSTDKKFAPGTWLYVKLSATGTSANKTLVTSMGSSEDKVAGYAETSTGSGIYKFQVMKDIETPDTLFLNP